MEASGVAVRVERGGAIESVHRAHVAAADATGDVVARFGDPAFSTFVRSSMKAWQLAPLLASGAADRFGFSDAELAVMCASHSGEPVHVKAVAGILERIGLGASALGCGAHAPYDAKAARDLERRGEPFTALHNNCSGKHANLLAQCVAEGWPTAGYLAADHPVQARVRALVAKASGTPEAALRVGVDGCTAPNYAMPVASAARLFATLARPGGLGKTWEPALARIFAAMTKHPEMVAGTDRFDTALMEAADGRLAGKVGGEACFGVADSETGLGLFVKIEDGGMRAVPPVVVEACRQLGWLEGRAFEVLGEHWRPTLTNWNGIVVGRMEPVLALALANR